MRRALISIDLIGFGLYLGLPRRELMTLALGGVLGGLADRNDPNSVVSVLLKYRGLGAQALPLMLLLQGASVVRKGQRSSVTGEMLALVELYAELVFRGDKSGAARGPSRVIKALKENKYPWVPPLLQEQFAQFKGPYPLGSIVVLSSKRLAVVASQPEREDGKTHPVVRLINKQGALCDLLDLSEHKSITILGCPDPEKLPVRLQFLNQKEERPQTSTP